MSYSREVLDTFITSGEAKLVGELPPLKKENKIDRHPMIGFYKK